MIRALREAGSVHPNSPRKNDHKKEEEDACDFEPDDSAYASEGTQEPAYAARNVFSCFSGSLTSGAAPSLDLLSGLDGGLARRGIYSGLCTGGHMFTCHTPGHPQADAERSPNGLRFHSVMMVAATLADSVFFRLLPVGSCSRTAADVR